MSQICSMCLTFVVGQAFVVLQ